jgi:hypothetical protein
LENQISKPNIWIWSIFWRFGFDQIFLAKPNPNSSHSLQAILFQHFGHFACGSSLFFCLQKWLTLPHTISSATLSTKQNMKTAS